MAWEGGGRRRRLSRSSEALGSCGRGEVSSPAQPAHPLRRKQDGGLAGDVVEDAELYLNGAVPGDLGHAPREVLVDAAVRRRR